MGPLRLRSFPVLAPQSDFHTTPQYACRSEAGRLLIDPWQPGRSPSTRAGSGHPSVVRKLPLRKLTTLAEDRDFLCIYSRSRLICISGPKRTILLDVRMAKLEANWLLSTGEMADRIRRHQWAGTALGSASGWSDRLKLMIEQVLASPLVASLVCGPERILIYNDAAARLYGDRHPAALGRPLPDAFPEGWATVAPFYQRAFNGETVTVAGQPLDTRGEGSATEAFDALLTPVREVNSAVAYVHTTSFDIADRQRIEAGLRESEAKYRSLFQRMGQGFCELELLRDEAGRAVDQRYIAFNPAFERLFGIPVSEATSRTASEVFPDLEPW